jgi:hypothetical protein
MLRKISKRGKKLDTVESSEDLYRRTSTMR